MISARYHTDLYLISKEMIKTIVQVIQAQFAEPKAENWAIVCKRVTENSLVGQDGEPIVGNIIQ